MCDVSVIRPLALMAFLGLATARPTVVDYATTKPSRFDERDLGGRESTNLVTSDRLPAELAPAHGPHYHDVVFDISSENAADYNDVRRHDSGSDMYPGGSTYYPSLYESVIHSFGPFGDLYTGLGHSSLNSALAKRSLVSHGRPGSRLRPTTEVPRKVPFSVGYTREDDWRPLSTSVHSYASSHRELFNVPPFSTAAGLRHR